MRRLYLLLIFTLLPLLAYSAPCYGPQMPEKGQWFAGEQTYMIFDRELEDNWGRIRSTQIFMLLSYGITDWLSLDLKGGAGTIKNNPQDSGEVDYDSSFAGGYGVRCKLFDKHNIKSILGFQHISVHPRRTRLGAVKHQAVLDDWQFSWLAGYQWKLLQPYAGLRWSRCDYIHWNGVTRKRHASSRKSLVGAFFGGDIFLTDKFWINLEGQLDDGTAASFALNYAF